MLCVLPTMRGRLEVAGLRREDRPSSRQATLCFHSAPTSHWAGLTGPSNSRLRWAPAGRGPVLSGPGSLGQAGHFLRFTHNFRPPMVRANPERTVRGGALYIHGSRLNSVLGTSCRVIQWQKSRHCPAAQRKAAVKAPPKCRSKEWPQARGEESSSATQVTELGPLQGPAGVQAGYSLKSRPFSSDFDVIIDEIGPGVYFFPVILGSLFFQPCVARGSMTSLGYK